MGLKKKMNAGIERTGCLIMIKKKKSILGLIGLISPLFHILFIKIDKSEEKYDWLNPCDLWVLLQKFAEKCRNAVFWGSVEAFWGSKPQASFFL